MVVGGEERGGDIAGITKLYKGVTAVGEGEGAARGGAFQAG